MAPRFLYYTNQIIRLPRGLAFLIFLMLFVLIPIILSLLIAGGIATLLVKSLSNLLPQKKKKIEYDDYEVIEISERERLN